MQNGASAAIISHQLAISAGFNGAAVVVAVVLVVVVVLSFIGLFKAN